MSMTGLEAFDRTIHKTNIWLRDLMVELEWTDRHKAYRALRATLHVLRDRLTVDEAAELGAQLPMLVRGFYYESWDPKSKPEKFRTREEFLARIGERFAGDGSVDPGEVAEAVFKVMAMHLTPGEVRGVKRTLPEEIRELWPPEEARAA